MSPKERELHQHETIDTMSKQLATIFKWWPIFTALGGLILVVGSFSIAAYKYDNNLVKKDEYAKMIKAVERIASGRVADSVYSDHEFVSVNKRVDSLADSKSKKKRGYMQAVTETKDKNGVITFNPVN